MATNQYYYIHNNVDWRAFGEVVFDVVTDNIRQVGKIISMDEFLHIPDNIGGHVGIIPWYPAYVRDESGAREHHYMVRLAVTNHMYVSDFGGGFGVEDTPLTGLLDELKEEVPQWKRLIARTMANTPRDQILVLMVEKSLADPDSGQRTPIPLEILILLPLSAKNMDAYPFKVTSEIRAIMDRTIEQFHEMVDTRPTVGNTGIRLYSLFHKMAPKLFDTYYYSVQSPETEYVESALTDNHVQVVLGDDKTTLPLTAVIREDIRFSRQEEKAWKKRKNYGQKMMEWRAPAMNRSRIRSQKARSVTSKPPPAFNVLRRLASSNSNSENSSRSVRGTKKMSRARHLNQTNNQ